MQRRYLIAFVSVGICVIACHSKVMSAATLLFPPHDANGNDITTPLTTSVSPAYSIVGIGFKSANDPNSLLIPNTTPDPTALTVTDGGSIPVLSVIVGNASTVNLNGTGQIGGNVFVYDTSTINMSGGTLGFHPAISALFGFDESKLNISGGTIAGGLVAYNQSNVTLSGGQVNAVFADGGTINVTGGTVVSGYEANSGTLNVSIPSTYLFGGSGVSAYNSATVNITGGGTLGFVQASGQSVVTLSGVTTFGTVAADNSVVNYSGGSSIGGISATNGSTVTVNADSVPGHVNCDSSVVEIPNATVGFLSLSGSKSGRLHLGNGTVLGTVLSDGDGEIHVDQGLIGGLVSASGNSHICSWFSRLPHHRFRSGGLRLRSDRRRECECPGRRDNQGQRLYHASQ